MATHLESSPSVSCLSNSFGGTPEPGKADNGGHEEQAVRRDKAKLHECEGDGITELIHDGFSGVG
jgi:hypothetical protein